MSEPLNAMRQSPAEREAAKTRAERAEDVAYTLNHAISCGTNDMFIAPTISALFGVQVGCSDPTHDHGTHAHHEYPHAEPHTHIHVPTLSKSKWKFVGHDAPHGNGMFRELLQKHAPAKPHTHASKFSWKLYRSEALHYLKGEIIGDAVAVPLTIATQRFAPSLMDGIRKLVEPIAAPIFRHGAKASAKKWGVNEGLAADAPEVVARAEAMYRSEMKHLPQAVMWNVFAFPIGVVTQKMGGHGSSYARIIRNKSIGAVISNVVLLGGRALAPNVAQQWDAFNSTHVIEPITNLVSASRLDMQSWAARVQPDNAAMTRTP